MKREQIIEKFLHWLLRQRFMEMVETIGVDGIAKKYLKETGEDKVAIPLDVPSDEEIEKLYPTNLDEIKKQEKLSILSYEAETVLRRIAYFNSIKQALAKEMRDEIIKRNQK